ncbi:hypothetical protein CSKR_104139 [Clonorchis sinensis]|uniref:Uncharacterized protein n=2 Tax=Clonorchis sinensis TaxID=79923 RepID=A0A8T1ML19_CLOSI|nr:hypothetical protein CSKR_104139 [Clonorchis sinensis]GAA51095.1 hypothetical protein CLF_105580 [Clonorchis sinensis]
MGNELSQSGEPGNPSDHISYETAGIPLITYQRPLDDTGRSIPCSRDNAIPEDDQSRSCPDNRRNQAITAEAEKQANEMCLTDEEKDHINQVLSRVRRLEEQEESRILSFAMHTQAISHFLKKQYRQHHLTNRTLMAFVRSAKNWVLKMLFQANRSGTIKRIRDNQNSTNRSAFHSYWYTQIPVVTFIERPQNSLETSQEASAFAVPKVKSACYWLRKKCIEIYVQKPGYNTLETDHSSGAASALNDNCVEA